MDIGENSGTVFKLDLETVVLLGGFPASVALDEEDEEEEEEEEEEEKVPAGVPFVERWLWRIGRRKRSGGGLQG